VTGATGCRKDAAAGDPFDQGGAVEPIQVGLEVEDGGDRMISIEPGNRQGAPVSLTEPARDIVVIGASRGGIEAIIRLSVIFWTEVCVSSQSRVDSAG